MAGEKKSPVLWLAGLAFAILIAAWIVFFVIAAKHPVEEVPLQGRQNSPH